MEDTYQERYLAHQKRKKDVLVALINERHSNRLFSDDPLHPMILDTLIESAQKCPSSCDRHGVKLSLVTDRDKKALLGGLLVGGVGWIHRAPAVILLIADPVAYKAGNEIEYMPYLDAGVIVGQLYLYATALDLHCAFANPNIREFNKAHFSEVFGDGVFCGAFAVGLKP